MVVAMHLIESSDAEMYRFTVCSRMRDSRGNPINNEHILWESCQTKEHAMAVGQLRNDQGYWVDVFENIAYNTALYQPALHEVKSQGTNDD